MAKGERKPIWSPGLAVLIAALGLGLGFVIWAFFQLWALAKDATLTIHGWIAMSLAGVLTLALGGGLMWLAFYSARKGYDDQVQNLDE